MSGRYPFKIISPDDWIFINDKVIKKLQKLSESFLLVFVSNQSKFTDIIKEKFEMIISELENSGIKLVLYILKSKTWKKPEVKCYDHLLDHIKIEPTEIRVVGDACSSVSNFPSYQWSNSDFEFFTNLDFANKNFYLPNKIFINTLPKIPEGKNVVLMMGTPGSGKTTFTEQLKNYTIISGDKCGYMYRQINLFKKSLANGKNVVVDNLNASKKTRSKFIEIALEMGYQIIIVWSLKDGRPFNALREKPVPAVVYGNYSKQFEMPTTDEGIIITF